MRAPDQSLVGHVLRRALERAADARVGQRVGDAPRPLVAPAADGSEPLLQLGAFGIDAERDDVQRDVVPAHRKFAAIDETDTRVLGGRAGLLQPAGFVVIGERPDVDATSGCATGDFGRGQKAVGMGRMAMQVVAKHAKADKFRDGEPVAEPSHPILSRPAAATCRSATPCGAPHRPLLQGTILAPFGGYSWPLAGYPCAAPGFDQQLCQCLSGVRRPCAARALLMVDN